MKSEQDKGNLEKDLQEARGNLEESVLSKAEIDRSGKLIQGSIVNAHQKLGTVIYAAHGSHSNFRDNGWTNDIVCTSWLSEVKFPKGANKGNSTVSRDMEVSIKASK